MSGLPGGLGGERESREQFDEVLNPLDGLGQVQRDLATVTRKAPGYVEQHKANAFGFGVVQGLNGNTASIRLLLNETAQIKYNAGIKHQCARHKSYGDGTTETALSALEARHSRALRFFTDIVWSEIDPPGQLDEIFAWMFEAVLFQRERTALEVEKTSSAIGALQLEMFKEHLKATKATPSDELIIGILVNSRLRMQTTNVGFLGFRRKSALAPWRCLRPPILKGLPFKSGLPPVGDERPLRSFRSRHLHTREIA